MSSPGDKQRFVWLSGELRRCFVAAESYQWSRFPRLWQLFWKMDFAHNAFCSFFLPMLTRIFACFPAYKSALMSCLRDSVLFSLLLRVWPRERKKSTNGVRHTGVLIPRQSQSHPLYRPPQPNKDHYIGW
jgi:hypothetical protein